jgi:hypothetical protein
MTNEEVAKGWERAKMLAMRIWDAYVYEVGTSQAKKDQQSLKIWLDLMREFGYVYNGQYDEYVNLKF